MFQYIKRHLKKNEGSKEVVYWGLSPKEIELISGILLKKLTYLSYDKLISLVKTCKSIEENDLSGIFLEAGCALGGSAILIALLKRYGRPFLIYDVFGMMPPPTKEDPQEVHDRYKVILDGESEGIDGDKYYGYEEHLYEIAQSNLISHGINCEEQSVTLIKGLIQDTMKIDQPVAFAHVDIECYEPVMTCLNRIFPKLVVGGSIILDDYHSLGGCKKATDEYLRGVTGQFVMDDSYGSMKITKV